jgi:hypothetical protein
MKIFSTILLFIFLSIPLSASAQQAETLFDGDVRHGGFGSLLFGATFVNGEASYLRGTRGAWVIKFPDNNSLHIGLGSYRTQTGFDAVNWPHGDIALPEMRTNYGGFELEYLNRSNKLVHFGAQALIGGGTVRYHNRNIDLDKTSDSYFAFQPGANAHLNVTTWFRLSGGLFYRYAGGVNLDGTSNSDLSGFSAIFGLRFGKF